MLYEIYVSDVTGHPLLGKVCSFVANLVDLAIALGAAVVLIRVRSVDLNLSHFFSCAGVEANCAFTI